MYAIPILKLLHVLSAFWFVAGLVARDLTRWQARRKTSIQNMRELIELASFFDRRMVQPGSIFVLVFGLALAPLQGWFREGDNRGNSNWLTVSILLYLTVAALIPVFIRRGKRFREALNAAVAEGRMTTELQNAFSDRVITVARVYEYFVVTTVLVLMILKPF